MEWLKVTVLYLLDGVPLALLFLLPGLWLLRRPGRKRRGLGAAVLGGVILLLLSTGPVARGLLGPLERQHPALTDLTRLPAAAEDGQAVWIVVLGSDHRSDAALPVTSQLSPVGVVRLVEALRLHRALPGSRLLLAGYGLHDPVSNAEMMASVARALGVASAAIALAPDATRTWDEAQAARRRVGAEPLLLVTSASHMPRAVALFRAAGLDPLPAPAGHRADTLGWLPSTANLAASRAALSEYAALALAHARGEL